MSASAAHARNICRAESRNSSHSAGARFSALSPNTHGSDGIDGAQETRRALIYRREGKRKEHERARRGTKRRKNAGRCTYVFFYFGELETR